MGAVDGIGSNWKRRRRNHRPGFLVPSQAAPGYRAANVFRSDSAASAYVHNVSPATDGLKRGRSGHEQP